MLPQEEIGTLPECPGGARRGIGSQRRLGRAGRPRPGRQDSGSLGSGASEYEKQVVQDKASADRQLRKNLTQALARIREGTFGECANCGGEIEPKHLDALPWARYCIKCQEEMEQK